MEVFQKSIKFSERFEFNDSEFFSNSMDIVFVFASSLFFEEKKFINDLQKKYSNLSWMGCSTAGEISQLGVRDETCVLTGVKFKDSKKFFKVVSTPVEEALNSYQAAEALAKQVQDPSLKSIFVLSPGVNVNGSELVKGLSQNLPDDVKISGGLAGDGGKFEKTYTLSTEGIHERSLIGFAVFGNSLDINYGSRGGWSAFGKARKVTAVENNILYELDGEPALAVYKNYLGDMAKDLPASGLLFPFEIISENEKENGLIRTILGIDESKGSLILAGDIPKGSNVRLMQANSIGLTEGSKLAANRALKVNSNEKALALVISCVGRKIVMGVNVEDEIDVVKETFGSKTVLAGFYSYGEISPDGFSNNCQLHNQTMTITRMIEIDGN